MRRRLTNLFLVVVLGVLFLDGLPSYSGWQDRGKEIIDPLLDVTGLWQGTWDLFAPEIDRQNNGIEIRVTLRDSDPVAWRSPDWTEMPWVLRFWKIRRMEFFDRIRSDVNHPAWESFARYSRNRLLHDGEIPSLERIETLELRRHWRPVPPPGSDRDPPAREETFFESPPQPRNP